ncbi:MAG: molybdopterin dinucleotide binding domain-containing protein, partial [Pirellulaceae bacterium]
MAETFIMIPGRTSKQGCGISEGKFGETYQSETTVLQVAPQDMERLGLREGDRVRVTSEDGQIEIDIKPSKGDELPP